MDGPKQFENDANPGSARQRPRGPKRTPTAGVNDANAGAEADGKDRLSKRQKRRRRKIAASRDAAPAFAEGGDADRRDQKAGLSPAEKPEPPAGQRADAREPGQRGMRKMRRSRSRGGNRKAEASPSASPSPHAAPNDRAADEGRTRVPDGQPDANGRQAPVGASAGAGSRRPAAQNATPSPIYAALDLGTNNCRLLMAAPTRPGQFRVIDAFSRIVRLGEGLGRTGSLSKGAMDRAVAALNVCAQKLAARDVTRMRLIATEACRAAANGEEFIERVGRETGLDLEIVSREAEARLAVSGCGSLIEAGTRGAVLFDIGGGSSEIALLDLRDGPIRKLANRIVGWTSLPVGVVSLAERHGGRNVTPELFETMILETIDLIEDFPGREKLDDLIDTPGFHLLGTSGTVTTLAGIHLNLERYDRRQVDGLWLTRDDADRLVAKILSWSFEERVANPCIGSDRADLVLAGCAILEAIRRIWPARALRVADRGLREGLLIEMMIADRVWRRSDRSARRSA
ncbi:Ppx/GppA family phosphatase [Fulvimarina sp. 2208YS6-2-32]|uniref:Ppx/GppA family phosphatase n=1 Tax=Fulvimarina uroteuthidis TaxID=3098149 RepID=A0ABU5I2N9_9HYPH|nr:Ppx/GppA family phosphatase [Fulvimarina sp. 2208YS6-2-32]MDY8109360.1 Ppx/GppA family phosphatase [Fulvimarina sp. 2208YS6-2-32]